MERVRQARWPILIAALTAGVYGTTGVRPPIPQPACVTMNTERLPLNARRSPLDSVTFRIRGQPVKICYGRPSARGRTIFGGLVPYNRLWRTGANEPTMIHTTVPLTVAGIAIGPGSYSLYTVPGPSEWEIIVNRSVSQWGHEGAYTAEVRAQEVGRARVKAGTAGDDVETFTISALPDGDARATVILEWERTRVEIPVAAAN